ncbi:location of vulva defective 1-like isoform X2 [Wyeomyia smithii]|uniref:location of vulva defective 1-like isoform X2 n=1 Tax=Wyeomyia smithii TaxID=174621 RepID=UPI002467E796|nr:location of vulva defective 1-like isoform X2 [Wyeomyia smithii]
MSRRYGRVQSVRIITSSAYNPNPSTSTGGDCASVDTTAYKEHHQQHGGIGDDANPQQVASSVDDFESSTTTIPTCSSSSIASSPAPAAGSAVHSTEFSTSSSCNSNSCSHSTGSHKHSFPSGNGLVISVCATIAFMDIKSASKAHIAEHKFDDRILTTEYYEPSLFTMPPTVAPSTVTVTPGNSCNTTTTGDNSCSSASSTTMHKHTIGNNISSNSSNSVLCSGNNFQYSSTTMTATAFQPSSSSSSGTTPTTPAVNNNSNNCPNGSTCKSDSCSGSKLLMHPNEHSCFYECNNSNNICGNSRTSSFNRLQTGTNGDEHCSSSSIGAIGGGGNGRRLSASSYSRELIQVEGQCVASNTIGGSRSRQRDRPHYRKGPYLALPERRCRHILFLMLYSTSNRPNNLGMEEHSQFEDIILLSFKPLRTYLLCLNLQHIVSKAILVQFLM